MKRSVLIVGLIIVIISTGYLLVTGFNRQPQSKVPDKSVQDKPAPQTELQEAAITFYSEDGKTKWELKAKAIKRFANRPQVILDQIQATVYQKKKEVITLIANRGEFDPQTGFLALQGPLTIKSEQKSVTADKLNWNQTKNELTGRGNVIIKQPGLEVTGDDFVSQVDLEKLRVLGNVTVISEQVGEANEE